MASIFPALKRIYEGNSVGALRGSEALYIQAKKEKVKNVTRAKVKEFLATSPIYYTQRRNRLNFKRRHINASFTGDLIQGDIWVLDRFEHANRPYKYCLIMVDTFSHHLSVVPMKDKSVGELKRALDDMMKRCGYKVYSILFDGEGAMESREMKQWLKDKGIHQMRTMSKVKAPSAERMVIIIHIIHSCITTIIFQDSHSADNAST